MSQFDYRQFYERRRPHIHPPGATLFLTFRLAGSIPRSIVRQYKAKRNWLEAELNRVAASAERTKTESQILKRDRILEFQREWFAKFEDILHRAEHGPLWLAQPAIRELVREKLFMDDGDKYRLDAFSIMANHVHAVFRPFLDLPNLREVRDQGRPRFVTDEQTLAEIMQSLKGVTAREANKVLKRRGSFWETESFDHYVRNEVEFERIVKYTLNNPVKARLVDDWRDWPGNYVSDKLKFVEHF